METKRLVLAVALSVVLLLLWNKLFPPPQRPPPQAPAPAELSAPAQPTESRPADAQDETPEAPAVEALMASAVEKVVIENDLYEVVLTNRGGCTESWKLRQHTTSDGLPLELLPRFEGDHQLPLSIDLDDAALADELNRALFRVERSSLGRGGEKVVFNWSDGRGLSARKEFVFRQGDYLVDLKLDVIDRGRRLDARISLGPGFSAQESDESRSNYYYASQAVWNLGGEVTRLKRGKLTKQDDGFQGRLYWVGLEDQFFAALLLPGEDRARVRWRSAELLPSDPQAKEAKAQREPILSVSVPAAGAQLYVGPKQYKLLRRISAGPGISQGRELEKAVWFSSQGWLAWIVKHIYLGLLWIHDHIVGNYGMAIVLATMVLRTVLFPVNQYSMVAMKKSQLQMSRLQPKVKSIRNKYKKSKDAQSRAKMNQETMDLYKREGVNPMGGLTGCLPLLAQFPILIGFYNMLTVAVELRGAPFFGWIRDLSVPDPYWVTPLLMGATMFIQQRMAMSKVKDPQQLQQQRIMMFMPFMFMFICFQMPAGLVLYWFVNNVLGMGQQWLVNRQTGRLEAAAQKA